MLILSGYRFMAQTREPIVSRTCLLPVFLVIAAIISGCSITAPRYSANYAGATDLKSANLVPMRVADIARDNGSKKEIESLTIRASSLHSPYGSFESYLNSALREDLSQSGLLAEQSDTIVSTSLIRNEIDASGFSTGHAEIEARFEVRRAGKVVYDHTKVARHEWPSSFVGGVAIPRAAQNYPLAVSKLLGTLYADPQFIAALKK
jgi:hypothetical protein